MQGRRVAGGGAVALLAVGAPLALLGGSVAPEPASAVRAQAVTDGGVVLGPRAERRAGRTRSAPAGPPSAPALVPRDERVLRPRVVRVTPVGQGFSGVASWYGPGFHGKRTANGERYDEEALTAASRTLPFGTRLQVCRGARCVVVRVNDRGPYVDGRVLDLSRGAARVLGLHRPGVDVVRAVPVAATTSTVPVPVRTTLVGPVAAAPPRALVGPRAEQVDVRRTPEAVGTALVGVMAGLLLRAARRPGLRR